MKQILQNLGSGETLLAEVPAPGVRAGHLLIETRTSLVSIGTEKMLIDFGKAGWIEKARKQPDKVRQAFEKIKTDGLIPTIDAVKAKLDQPIALGYCNVGTVIELGIHDSELGMQIGDRVVSNGPHAEVINAPKNLCAKVPDPVSDEEAAFTVVGAIGLQGIRLLQPTLGESFVVTGLGLIGLLCVQMLRAQGCRVLGIDFDSSRCALARQCGAETVDLSKGEDPITVAEAFSKGLGMDGVLITASTQSNEPMHQAALMCRPHGRIILVGVVGLELSRADFYEKELTFQVSCSYGPGRYDDNYEQQGHDYPAGFVRWTEQRNFEAVLEMMASRRIDVRPLITHRFPFDQALRAYEMIGDKNALGIILEYRNQKSEIRNQESGSADVSPASSGDSPKEPFASARNWEKTVRLSGSGSRLQALSAPVVGLIGAGGFTGQVLLPALKATGARLKIISSVTGVSGTHLGKKFGFETSTTDTYSLFADPEIDTVVITTRHNSHARFVLEALQAGKNVYVEKPLCLTRSELQEITAGYEQAGKRALSHLMSEGENTSQAAHPLLVGERTQVRRTAVNTPFLMVGFNRRFAPQVQKMKELLSSLREPKTFVMTVNAGAIPADHWTQDANVGGGRIIGEGCHFIDLLRFLAGSAIASVQAMQVGEFGGGIQQDKMSFTLRFADGSVGTVHYFANGHKSFPKERLEVFCAGRVLQLDNFRRLKGFGWPRFTKMNLWSQDKGHKAEMQALIAAIQSGNRSPIPFEEITEVTRASFDVVEQIRGS